MSSPTGGVKAFSIQGRLYRERERLHGKGMTDAERAWRKQWIQDQQLSHNEPRVVPEMYKARYNPIRRAYWIPLNTLEKALTPLMGKTTAHATRVVTGKVLMGLAFVYSAVYYFKYNSNDWTRKGGWRVLISRPTSFPGEPSFPTISKKIVGSDYGTRNFENSPI